jgi:hypothetical protein
VESRIRVTEAMAVLKGNGVQISPDKLQRWRCFGIESVRVGRANYLDPPVYRNLQYILEIERRFGFSRDHDGLALELAYRRYPTVPWDRVHDGACKELRIMFNKFSRELYRIDNSSGFVAPRANHLARMIARRYIPDRKIKEGPSRKVARDILVRVAELWLRVTYNNESIKDYQIRPILYIMGGHDPLVIPLAASIAVLLNIVVPILRVNHRNSLHEVLESDFDIARIQATVSAMRSIFALNQQLWIAGVAAFESHTVDYPSIEDVELGSDRTDISLRSMIYAGAAYLEADPAAKPAMDLFKAGTPPDLSVPIAQLAGLKNAITTVFSGSLSND